MSKICKSCKTKQEDFAIFCGKCGAKIDQEILCPRCNKKLPEDAAFCVYCGSKAETPIVLQPQNMTVQPQYTPPQYAPPQYVQPQYVQPVSQQPAPVQYFDGQYIAYAPRPKIKMEPKRVKSLYEMIAAWVIAAVFALIFGLSFLPVVRVEVPNAALAGYGKIYVNVSAVNYIEVLFYQPTSDEAVKDLEQVVIDLGLNNISSDPTTEQIRQVFNRFNILKIIYCQETLEAAPVSGWFGLVLGGLLSLIFLIGTFAFFVTALILAITESLNFQNKAYSSTGKYRSVGKIFFAVTAAFCLIFSALNGNIGSALISGLILSCLFLIFRLIADRIIYKQPEGAGNKQPEGIGNKQVVSNRGITKTVLKNYISTGISILFGAVLLLLLPGNFYKQQYKVYGSTYKTNYGFTAGIGFIDMFNKYKELGLDQLNLRNASTIDFLNMFFYKDTASYYASGMAIFGVLSLIFYLAAWAVLSTFIILLFLNLAKQKISGNRALHIIAPMMAVVLLILTFIPISTVKTMLINYPTLKSMEFKIGITAIPVLMLIFSIGMMIQNFILYRKPQKAMLIPVLSAPLMSPAMPDTAQQTQPPAALHENAPAQALVSEAAHTQPDKDS